MQCQWGTTLIQSNTISTPNNPSLLENTELVREQIFGGRVVIVVISMNKVEKKTMNLINKNNCLNASPLHAMSSLLFISAGVFFTVYKIRY